MDEKQFKKTNKFSLCTKNPIEYLIPFNIRKETLLKIKNEVIDAYGEDIASECPKRKQCSLSKTCLGRPLFDKSPTALPYLEKLSKTQKIVSNELFVTGCNGCPIQKSCSSPCPTINNYVQRDKVEEPSLVYNSHYSEKILENIDINSNIITPHINNSIIPWDAISSQKVEIVKTYLYEQRDFQYLAKKFNLNNGAKAKYDFYAALTKLSEYGIMREFLEKNEDSLTETQKTILNMIYINNMLVKDVAKIMGVDKSTISKTLSRIIKANNIKWQVFVKKPKNGDWQKAIYNTQEIIK